MIRSYWYSKNSASYVLNNLVLIKKFNIFYFIIKFYHRWNGNYNNYILFKRRGILLIWRVKKPWIPFSRSEGCLIEIEQMVLQKYVCIFPIMVLSPSGKWMALQFSSQESLAQVYEKGTKITLLYKTLNPMQPELHKSWLTQSFHKSNHCKWVYGFCKDRLKVDLSFLLKTCMKFTIKSHTWALKKNESLNQ